MTDRLTVAAVSPAIRTGAVERNLGELHRALAWATAHEARLTVLPELATSGYLLAGSEQARQLAWRGDDPRLAALARRVGDGAVAVVGFCEADGPDLYNSAAVLADGRVLAVYRKCHLWGDETAIFTPGDEAGVVIETPIGRLGVALCYDNEFPEVPRGLALAGARILALPVAWPRVDRPAGEHAPESIQAMAAARSSRLAIVIADHHGQERDTRWTGGTAVVDADGWMCAGPADRALATVALRTDTRAGEHNDLFADRRPGLYHL